MKTATKLIIAFGGCLTLINPVIASAQTADPDNIQVESNDPGGIDLPEPALPPGKLEAPEPAPLPGKLDVPDMPDTPDMLDVPETPGTPEVPDLPG